MVTKVQSKMFTDDALQPLEEQLTGLVVHPTTINETASVGDTVGAGTSALRDAVNNKVYTTSAEVSGTITAVDFDVGTATVGGVGVTLLYFNGLAMSTRQGAQTPVSNVTPRFIGDEYFDTSSGQFNWYKATGLTSTDWKQIT